MIFWFGLAIGLVIGAVLGIAWLVWQFTGNKR